MTLFRTDSATVDELVAHLEECDDAFVPPLSERVAIPDYAIKLAERATRFEAWSDGRLVGLVATYWPQSPEGPAFITNVSLSADSRGHGLATTLLERCAAAAQERAISHVRLEVERDNARAIRLYTAMRFRLIEQTGSTLTMERATAAGEDQ